MPKRLAAVAALLIAVLVGGCVLTPIEIPTASSEVDAVDGVVELVRLHHVDPAGEPTERSVEALKAWVAGLDPRSTLVTDDAKIQAMYAAASAAPQITARRDGTVAYIAVPRIDETTAERVEAGVRTLRAGGPPVQGWVLDLRDNAGGLLDEATALADLFLDGGPVVEMQGRGPRASQRHAAKPGDLLAGARLVVLVNGRTSAGAEIVAGALQQRGRALLAGDATEGANDIQIVLPLRGGITGLLKLTHARWILPGRDAEAGAKLTPDIAVTGADRQLEAALAAAAR